MSEIIVGLGERSYPIVVESGCSKKIGSELKKNNYAKRYCVVSDDKVAGLYGQELIETMRSAGLDCSLVTFPHGESSKSLETLGYLAGELTRLGIDRKACVIGFGGGVTGDLAGFLAATFMRGIKFVQIPTTLLAQVDSSVGGKTGVDIPEGKNLLGCFYQPGAVFIDPLFLNSLPKAELLGGMAEVLKYGVIRDEGFFSFLQTNREGILALEKDLIESLVLRCCQIKAEVVAEDEREGDVRRILNFGHTIGHAVESASEFTLIHGLAVSIGMVAATRLSVMTDRLEPSVAEEIISTLGAYNLPLEIPETLDRNLIKKYLAADKKVIDGKIHFVLPVRIGATEIVSTINATFLDQILGIASN